MKQLTMKDIYEFSLKLKEQGLDLSKLPVYLGNDDELNGIHNGWYCELIDKKDDKFEYYMVLINDNCNATELESKGVVIS